MAEADRANRPSLGHLLLLITCCAIYFALARQILHRPLRGLSDLLLLSLLSTVTGICWSGTIVVVYRKLRSTRVTTEPGDWLMFCIGLVEATDILAQLLPDTFIIRRSSLPIAAECLVFVLPMLSRRLPPIWRILFAILVLSSAFPLCSALLVALDVARQIPDASLISQTVRPYLIVSAVAITSVIDWRANRKHGWSHWLGIACLVIWSLF